MQSDPEPADVALELKAPGHVQPTLRPEDSYYGLAVPLPPAAEKSTGPVIVETDVEAPQPPPPPAALAHLATADADSDADARPPSEKKATIWTAGTLVYTLSGLSLLFCWLLWGDFALSMRERSVCRWSKSSC